MIIPIDEKYRLKSDSNQWMIQRIRTREGETGWESFKYFSDLSKVATELVQLKIRESEAQTLAEALVDAKNATTDVLRALTPEFEVTER